MDDPIRRALSRGHTIDITTTGRRSGLPRRIEIYFFVIGGRIYISGMPNPERARAWLLNLGANPAMTFHLKGTVSADLPATARIVTDSAERRSILASVVLVWKGQQVEVMDRHSPLIEVTIDGYQPGIAA